MSLIVERPVGLVNQYGPDFGDRHIEVGSFGDETVQDYVAKEVNVINGFGNRPATPGEVQINLNRKHRNDNPSIYFPGDRIKKAFDDLTESGRFERVSFKGIPAYNAKY
jgi:hypothetical protein